VLEACVNGRYYWVPMSRLSRVELTAPEDLRDCVWTPATLMFSNGGETVALVPTRYPGSEASDDGAICLARKTEWLAAGTDRWFGLGQRLFSSDSGEYPIMAVRTIELDDVPAAAEAAGGPA
jgi:type VI secretion system protein ImpE